jgi:uncharacterized integral membrane protein (TIGR00697 family)
MNFNNRRDFVYLTLAGFFVTNAVLGQLIGGKLIQWGPFALSMGVLPWPIVLVMTDLINEHFGREGVRKLTFLTMGFVAYTMLIIFAAMQVPAADFSPVKDEMFNSVFGQSMWIIVGSIIAFALSQLMDVTVFTYIKSKTKDKFLWLRTAGSTAVSQLFDSLAIVGIAFWLPGAIKTNEFLNVALTNYSYKFLMAIGTIPLIYAAHYAINKILAKDKHT